MNGGLRTMTVGAPGRPDLAEAYRSVGMRFLLLGLIVGVFAFRLPVIVLLSLAVAAVVFVVLGVRRAVHPVGWLVIANYAFWGASGLVCGGISAESLMRPEFWRGEGRSFFFYMPLLAFSVLHVRRRELMFAVRIVGCLAALGSLMCVCWLLGWGHLFQAEEDPISGEQSTSIYFVGLLTSHTGAGTFWATVAAFLLAYSWRMRDKLFGILAIAAICLTLATGGRAATLGLLAAVGWLLLSGDVLNRRSLIIALPTIPISIAGSLFIASRVPEIGDRMGELISQRSVSSVLAAAREPTLEDASGFFYSGANLEHHNLVIRVYLWKYALRLARTSPLIGVGFGRFNDSYPDFRGIKHVVWLMVDADCNLGSGIEWEGEQLMVSTGNAHNSYLHVAAETGVLGLALFFSLWLCIWTSCRTGNHQRSCDDQFEHSYAAGCQSMIVCLLVAALAGHALCAPTGGILSMTVLGAWIAHRRLPQQ